MGKLREAAEKYIAWHDEDNAEELLKAVEEVENSMSWIPVADRLPEEGINPVTQDTYVYPVTVGFGNVKDVRYYSFCRGHWYNCGPNPLDDLVVAWLPRPEPYNKQTDNQQYYDCSGKGR